MKIGSANTQNSESDVPKERIRGTVLRVTYHNRENDYRVLKLAPLDAVEHSKLDKRGELVLVGPLPGLEVGESIEAEGSWGMHPKHGPQFRAEWFKPSRPTGTLGIEAYLSSGSFHGVGPVIAKRIVEKFGEQTLDVLEKDIERVRGIKGITKKKFEAIRQAWREAKGDRELVMFLGDHGISASWATRLGKVYGEAALSILRANPYRLAAEVRGVGFARADAMARQLGIALDSPERIDAAIGHVLEEQAGEGHTFLPRLKLIELSAGLLALEPDRVEERVAAMLEQKRISANEILDEPVIFLNSLLDAEQACARHLRRLSTNPRRTPKTKIEEVLENFQRKYRFDLSPVQKQAVLTIAREGVMVLTGGPGTGKTTTLRAVIHLFREAGLNVRLAAPTGRAARRLSETSHAPAETIHRLLAFQPHTGAFAHNESKPLEADLVVVDEVSMLDVVLARDLLQALANGTCLLLVGDEDQLPSVGPGNFLRDVIASNVMPVARLREIFRQAQSSLIVVNAHRINRGEPPHFQPPEGVTNPDFFFIERRDPEEIRQAIITLVTERIPAKYHFDPIRDIQILTPMRRGELGVHAINRELQRALNPAHTAEGGCATESEIQPSDLFSNDTDAKQSLRVGDRVMQTANNYDKEVFNGDIGLIERIDPETGEALVAFDGRTVSYLADEAKQLALAYAITIHKSQGSEYRAVVLPLHGSHYVMLRRNLLYTAVTRGKELVCVVGTKNALWRAVRDDSRQQRNSALGEFLRNSAKL